MYDIPPPASAPHRASPSEASLRRHSLANLRTMIATWRERRRFRCDLEQMSQGNPHLIDDIGLTGRQARAEIAKPFWQA